MIPRKNPFVKGNAVFNEGVSYFDVFGRRDLGARFSRIAGALGCHTRIREGFPRDGSRTVFFIVARLPSEVSIRASERVSPASSIVTMCVSLSVVCDRLITNRSGSGDPDLQG